MDFSTRCIHHASRVSNSTHPVVEPLYLTTAYAHTGERIADMHLTNGYDYARLQNPTREALEDVVCSLEGGADALAFSTGMAAIACLLELLKPGETLVTSWDLYGGTIRLFDAVTKKNGIKVVPVDTSDIAAVERALEGGARLLFAETPTNPTMVVSDIAALADAAHAAGALLAIDNTFLTPYFQRPFEFGADFVIHSATKYLAGHNDVLAGFLVVRDPDLAEQLRYLLKTIGSGLSAFDSWLVTRGLKTLPLRMEKHQENAFAVARWLKEQDHVTYVYYPGLEEHPGHELMRKQASGFGGMVTFGVDTKELAFTVLENVKLILFAESLGGTESLITHPKLQTHVDVDPGELAAKGIDECMLRISVGLESADDLIADLEQAFSAKRL